LSTHPYDGEDEDELTFEKGVVILVVPYEDPEDEVITEAIINIFSSSWLASSDEYSFAAINHDRRK
jgi:hypothetical protein